jgi:hypothetical protein
MTVNEVLTDCQHAGKHSAAWAKLPAVKPGSGGRNDCKLHSRTNPAIRSSMRLRDVSFGRIGCLRKLSACLLYITSAIGRTSGHHSAMGWDGGG